MKLFFTAGLAVLLATAVQAQPFLGLLIEEISPRKAETLGFETPYGVYLKGVVPGSGAEAAGLRATDYVIGIGEERVSAGRKLGTLIGQYAIGDEVYVVYVRDGQTLQSRVVLGSKSATQSIAAPNDCQRAFLGVSPRVGGALPNSNGVQVSAIPGSPAEDMGLKNGDQITRINGLRIVDWRDLSIAMSQVKPGADISVVFLRNGLSERVSATARSHADVKNCENCECSTIRIQSDDFGIDFDFDFNWNEAQVRQGSRVDVSGMRVQFQEPNSADYRAMQQLSAPLPENASLPVQDLRCQTNPESGRFILEFSLATKGDTDVRITNNRGRRIYEFSLSNFSGKFSDEVHLAQNGAGTYYLEIRQGRQAFVRKMQVE